MIAKAHADVRERVTAKDTAFGRGDHCVIVAVRVGLDAGGIGIQDDLIIEIPCVGYATGDGERAPARLYRETWVHYFVDVHRIND